MNFYCENKEESKLSILTDLPELQKLTIYNIQKLI